jgi:lipoprotein-releasing system permease protein
MAIAVAVAAVNVGSALSMLVVERKQDIAILKATGASPGFIGIVFLSAGLFTGGLGAAMGIFAGSLLAWRINDIIGLAETAVNAIAALVAGISGSPIPAAGFRLLDPSYYLSSIPVDLKPGSLGLVAILSLVLSAAVSLLPARKAARLSPLEIVRKV